MPYHYGNRTYSTFEGLCKAIRTKHPDWPDLRVRRYAGKIYWIEVGNKKRKRGK